MAPMKLKQVYKSVFIFCGVVFLISGLGCLVSGMLLQYDGRLQKSIESLSRVYSTQYWLGLPLIFYGVAVTITSKVHEKMQLIFFNLLATIPMLTFTFAASILHGTNLVHFVAMERQQSYLVDRGYLCEDSNADNLCLCKKPRDFQMQQETFSVLCSELSQLVTLHGLLFSFAVIATGFLFSILFTSVVFLLQLQLPAHANSTENQGFSNQGEDEAPNLSRHTASLLSLANSGISLPQSTIVNEPPPSYESLLSSFVVPGGLPSIGRNPPSAPRRPPEVNQHATVRYRGELNSDPESFPRARNPHGQATLHETTNMTGSTSQGDHAAIIEEVSTSNSNERGAQLRSSALLEDNTGSESEDNSTNHNATPHSNNPNLYAGVRESDPREDNVPEENTDIASTSENTENIERNSVEVDRREGEHENIPQEEDFVVTIVATSCSTESNTTEVEQSGSMALQEGSSDVTTAARVSDIPSENLFLPTQQTDNIRASLSRLTRDGVFENSVVDI